MSALTRTQSHREIIRVLARIWLVLLCMLLVLNATMSVAYAATNTLDEVIDKLNSIDITELPEWDEMTGFLADPDSQPDVQPDEDTRRIAQVKKEVYSKLTATYGTASKYKKFCAEFEAVAEVVDGSIQKKEELKGDSGQKRFEGLISGFNKSVGEAAVGNTAEKLFGTDNFDPNNNFLSPVMDWVYYLVNTFFSVCSQCLIWFMLAQAGADTLYIGVDWTRAFLTPYKEDNRNAAAGADGKKKFALPIISEEAYQSVHGGGGVGAGSGDSAVGGKKVITYLRKKVPIIMFGAVYLVMVFAGWWPRLISIISGIVITIFTYVLSFLGLM